MSQQQRQQGLRDVQFYNMTFPAKLFALLDDAETCGFQDIISWQPGGKSFKIHKPDEFSKTIMHAYFNQTKLKSCVRQINIYGFKLIQVGPNRGGYFHKMFDREHYELCQFIVRRKDTSKGPRRDQSQLPSKQYSAQEIVGTPVFLPSTMTTSLDDLMMAPLMFLDDNDDGCDQQQNEEQHGVHRRSLTDGSIFALDDVKLFDVVDSSDAKQQQQQQQQDSDLKFLNGFKMADDGDAALNDFIALFEGEDLQYSSDENNDALSMTLLGGEDDGTTTTSAATTCSRSDDEEEVANEEELSFPFKLHIMLDRSERDQYSHIVSWVKDGKAFRVHDHQAFVDQVMPNYFNQSKYESFRRQLNLYHFERCARGADRGIISHPGLQRGQRQLCRQIQRST